MQPWLSPSDIETAIAVGRESGRLRHQRPPRLGSPGQRPASLAGRGLDYADSRALAPGDDPRHINWRATARHACHNCAPLVRVYHPEVGSQSVLVLDGRQSLWFASRGRLKWAQALRMALCTAAAGMASAHEFAILRITDRERLWQPMMPAQMAIHRLVALAGESMRLPSPTDCPAGSETLWSALEQPARLTNDGARFLLVADQAGLLGDVDQADPLIRRLVRRFDLVAIEIIDPLDRQLPAAGALSLMTGGHYRHWASDQRAERDRYALEREAALEAARARLAACGVRIVGLATDADQLPDPATI